MGKSLKKFLKIFVPIAVGLFLVWYSYNSTTPEERKQIIHYISNASPFWVAISVIIGILSHISRAIRWKYLLEPLGYRPKTVNTIFIVLISYFANLGIPRSGEILRATALTTYEKVPFEKGFGTIVTERVIDLLMLLGIIMITLVLQTDFILGFLEERGVNIIGAMGILLFGIVGLFLGSYIIRKSKSPLALKLKGFLNGLQDGVLSVFKMKNKWPFILHTLFIWGAYFGMFWVIKYTVEETIPLSLGQLLVAFVAGAFAMSTTNGGIGLYPIAVSAALGIYGISSVSGDAFGWIMWIAQTIMVVVFGTISFIVLPLLNRNR
ncbi:MAG TPA: TIGR00374 family protein [Muricauda sp.]|uniref:Flippase-like domain-containing protein n=1 Tax=Flagellimonas aurea TaxID=2915619 RepID=A0ABS3G075_9FLAO|nr:lysylphosphatidylglycerol synthase transmembrane domain-containing protein [Allomuricauda aurea]MAO17845.1 TIGR00374 family protein [Allomuricauda sp.]UBZ15530.1 flippase-like domain-containing protein [Allomuricauda aquimarina]MBC72441.1 TIGR00374 family protein [Allomuricauda sp.]MBO0352517.1 flippase-like domain-containing protein [Allomuricauda aurea]HBU78211.1 TIGR00374 family protein [Allomuricauda sp.]